MAQAKNIGSGWHFQSIRHSNARRFGKAGGKYAVTIGGKPVYENLSKEEAQRKTRLMLAMSNRLDIFYKPMKEIETRKFGKIHFSDKEMDEQIKSLMENYPEAGSGMALENTDFDYDNFKYKFLDTETGKKYVVTKSKLRKAYKSIANDLIAGKFYHGWGDKQDAFTADALVQRAIFGEEIYG